MTIVSVFVNHLPSWNRPPKGWPRLSASVYYDDPRAAIEWLCNAFGFEKRLVVEGDNGAIAHSELTFGEGLVMVGGAGARDESEPWRAICSSPKHTDGKITGALCFFVDDCDAHHAIAAARDAKIVRTPVTNDYGDDYWTDRSYGALDPEGHLWWFMQRIKGA